MVQRVRCCSDWNACHAFVNNNMHGWKCTTATNVTNMRSHCYKIKHKWGKVHSCVVILFSMPHLNVWIMINGTCHVKKQITLKEPCSLHTRYFNSTFMCKKVSHWTMLKQNITTSQLYAEVEALNNHKTTTTNQILSKNTHIT